jgi:protein TonB
VAQSHDSVTKTKANKRPSMPPQLHRQAILGRIKSDISRYFYYPPQALRRGWEGIVLVRLRLLPNGKIESVRLASGSGHSVLDRAAIDSVEKIQRIAMSDLGVATTLDLQIPVIYRLRGG